MVERTHCDKLDHDGSGLTCGYPLPCPWHTFVMDLDANTLTVPQEEAHKRRVVSRLSEIMDVLMEPPEETPRH